MDCFRWARKEVGTTPFPKAKEYQKLKIEAYDQEEDSESEIHLYTTDDKSDKEESEEEPEEESEEELEEKFEEESQQEESVSTEKN